LRSRRWQIFTFTAFPHENPQLAIACITGMGSVVVIVFFTPNPECSQRLGFDWCDFAECFIVCIGQHLVASMLDCAGLSPVPIAHDYYNTIDATPGLVLLAYFDRFGVPAQRLE
jgi:hypothetical protein